MSKHRNRTALLALALGLPALGVAAVLTAVGLPSLAAESRKVVTKVAPKVVVVESDDAYLGVQIEEATDLAEGGARITEVVEGSPAERAGIRAGDVVVRFGGDTIRGPVALTERIHSRKPGEHVALTVIRDGKQEALDVELGERTEVWRGFEGLMPDPEQIEKWKELGERLGKQYAEQLDCEGDDCGMRFIAPGALSFGCEGDDCLAPLLRGWRSRPLLGVQLVEVTSELRRHLGSPEDRGVLVSRIVAGSPAEKGGIEVGDLIVSVGGATIADTGDLRDALAEREGKTFEIDIVRDRRTSTLSVTLPAPDEDEATGPQARAFREQQRAVARDVREALAQARNVRREAVYEASRAQREAMAQTREALREASRAQREAALDAARAARKAVREAVRENTAWRGRLTEI